MHRLISIFYVFSFLTVNVFAQTNLLLNGNLEGRLGLGAEDPPNWEYCDGLSTADIQPGNYNVRTKPESGKAYTSIITRGQGTTWANTSEDIVGKCMMKLLPSYCYQMNLYLARSATFGYSDGKKTTYFNIPTRIRIHLYDDTDDCKTGKQIWESPVISDTAWKGYSFNFQPDKPSDRIKIEILFADSINKNSSSNMLIDNVSVYQTAMLDITSNLYVNKGIGVAIRSKGDKNITWQPDTLVECKSCQNTKGTFLYDTKLNVISIADEGCVYNENFNIYLNNCNTADGVNFFYNESIMEGDSLLITLPQKGFKYLWEDPKRGFCMKCDTIIMKGLKEKHYRISVFDEMGCFKVYDYTIKVTENLNVCRTIKLPNIITPNDDGVNDNLIIHGDSEFNPSNIYIYNNWGNTVFSGKVYETMNWNFSHLSDGIYYFSIISAHENCSLKSWLQVLK